MVKTIKAGFKEDIFNREKHIIFNRERHIRWNWERSPEDPDLVRYHFVVIDDKNRDMIMVKLLESLCGWGSPLDLIRTRIGKVRDSDFFYFFQSYDSAAQPGRLIFGDRKVKRDFNLKERVRPGYSIEQYVEDEYSR